MRVLLVVMTLHKLHAGDGYTYLTRQVAAGDERRTPGQQLSDYYLASGNPPGRWMGAGAADLGVVGRVREDQMRALFGRGLHPDADQIITLEKAAGTGQAEAERAARLGRAFPQYTPLPPRSERVMARLADFESENGHPPSPAVRSKIEAQEARRDRRAVAGYDLVFTPIKSASLLWALGSTTTREAVEAAHHDAVDNTLAWLETETAFARIGDRGEQQIETRGFLATAFDHRDSRAGDPDLHTHLAISNKVRARDDYADGTPRWLSLDARVLHAAAVAASERYNTRFEDALYRRLDVTFVERAGTGREEKRPVREIAGVPPALIRHFSKRRAAIEARYDELLSDYRDRHAHSADTTAQLKLAQQATLETRGPKAVGASLAEKLNAWRDEARDVIGPEPLACLEEEVLGHADVHHTRSLEEIARSVVDTVSREKATFTRWNLTAEAERQLRAHRFSTPADREAATTAVVRAATSPEFTVQLTACGIEQDDTAEGGMPVQRRSNGESVLVQHGAARYTTQALLDAEHRLLDHAQHPTRYAIETAQVEQFLADFEARDDLTLDPGQRRLVHAFAANPNRLVVGIGPAGAGKTTAMRALTQAWRTTGHRVVPLAPSAAAAQVLADELGCRAENLHKFHHAHVADAGDPSLRDEWFALQPGDLVLVDEAGMAGTRHLDWLTSYARERGAVVRLLGDPGQLSAVEAGGALRLLASDVGAVELSDLHRFLDPDEAKATMSIRSGDSAGLAYYAIHDRIRSGARHDLMDQAFAAWKQDLAMGYSSLLIAAASRDVTSLNARAHAARVHSGEVSAAGVELHDGTTAAIGDLVVTRRNDRRLRTKDGRHFIKNGDTWTVASHHGHGGLWLRAQDGSEVRVPGAYVAEHVELGYATTAARAQGRTVDTAHAIIDRAYTRETFYVAATRARQGTRLYVETGTHVTIDADRPPEPAMEGHELLVGIITMKSAEVSATEIARRSDLPDIRGVYRRCSSSSRVRSGPRVYL